jgi:hypothetical protein
MRKEVLTNDLEMQKDEAKVLQAKKKAGNARGNLFAYRLRQSIPSTREDMLPTY